VTVTRRITIWTAAWAAVVVAAPFAIAQSVTPSCNLNAPAWPQAFIAAIVAFGGICGGVIAVTNYRKAVQWKRAEFTNSQLRELNANEEIVLACRSLDWMGGTLAGLWCKWHG
jgi:hypothetical protein